MTDLQTIPEQLTGRILRWEMPADNQVDLIIVPENLLPVVQFLHRTGWGYLAAITGLDHGTEASTMEALYHFCAGAEVLTLRVQLARNKPALPSICGIIAFASIFERELSEMFGVTIYDAPDSTRLFLPDDWPDRVYPLRKDFRGDHHE